MSAKDTAPPKNSRTLQKEKKTIVHEPQILALLLIVLTVFILYMNNKQTKKKTLMFKAPNKDFHNFFPPSFVSISDVPLDR